MKTFKKVLSLALALVMVVGALVVLPTEAKAAEDVVTTTSIWSGSQDAGKDWSGAVQIAADKFANLELDGSEVLEITYTTTDQADWGSSFKIASGWYSVVYEETSSGVMATSTVKSLILTSDFAKIKEEGIYIQGYNWTVTDVSITKYSGTTTELITESVDSGEWTTNITITADKFADLKFDGSEVLLVRWKDTDTTAWGVSFKFATVDPYATIVEGNENHAVIPTVKEIVLTSDWADIATTGLMIQGFNWTITDVELIVPTPEPEPTPGDDITPTGDFSMVLPLVLVLMGGAVVIVAAKKRFA